MSTTLMMGCYDYLGFDRGDETNWGEYEDWGAYEEGPSLRPLVYTTERIKYPATDLELYAGWSKCLADNVVAATGTDDDADGSQLPPPPCVDAAGPHCDAVRAFSDAAERIPRAAYTNASAASNAGARGGHAARTVKRAAGPRAEMASATTSSRPCVFLAAAGNP